MRPASSLSPGKSCSIPGFSAWGDVIIIFPLKHLITDNESVGKTVHRDHQSGRRQSYDIRDVSQNKNSLERRFVVINSSYDPIDHNQMVTQCRGEPDTFVRFARMAFLYADSLLEYGLYTDRHIRVALLALARAVLSCRLAVRENVKFLHG
jgi:hypothetical protein